MPIMSRHGIADSSNGIRMPWPTRRSGLLPLLRIACDDFQVPVEVKKNTHRDLWSAMRNQLIEHYTAEPATGGYGIYAAFWFGANRTQLPPSGRRPANPEDLEKRLLEALSAKERRKVSVCVIDVSRP